MEKRNLTCIICPMGCLMEIGLEGNTVVSVSGNSCDRGSEYARKELTNPTRTVTTTAAVSGGVLPLVPVKTAAEIPRGLVMHAMEILRRRTVPAPVARGDVIIHDILGTGVNVIACADVAAKRAEAHGTEE